MSLNINHSYRIKRNADYDDKMRYLVQELKLFKSYSSLLVISAVIGFNNNHRYPFEKNAESVLMQFFTDDNYDLFNLIGYADYRSQAIFKKMEDGKENNKQFEIFEQYANGGFPILIDKLGIDFIDKTKNDKRKLTRSLYALLLSNGFYK